MRTRKKGPKSKATKFTHAKFCWLEQVARDNRNLPTLAPAVCIELCHYFNLRYDGAARVWQDALAQALGVRREAINKVIKALVERGRLSSTRCGRDQPNRYQMVLKDAARCAQESTSSAPMMCDHDVRKQRLRCAPQSTYTPSTPENSKEFSKERESEQLALLSISGGGAAPLTGAPTEEAREAAAAEGREEESYSELRAIWCRPWADDAAADRRAFDLARQEVAPADIIVAARTWAAAVEPRFLPALAKWLNGRGWEKPQQRKKAARGHHRNGHKADMAKLALMAGGYVEDASGRMVWPGGPK